MTSHVQDVFNLITTSGLWGVVRLPVSQANTFVVFANAFKTHVEHVSPTLSHSLRQSVKSVPRHKLLIVTKKKKKDLQVQSIILLKDGHKDCRRKKTSGH